MSTEIQELHAKLVSQIEPPKYKYKMRLNENNITFRLDTTVDVSHIEITDPISQILLDECIRVGVDKYNKECYIESHNYSDSQHVFNRIEQYLLKFLRNHMKQKNPKVTKLYKWMSYYLQKYNAPNGFLDEQLMLFKYLKANIGNNDSEVHIKNGIGILNALKTKYEKQGYELGDRHGRRRRRY